MSINGMRHNTPIPDWRTPYRTTGMIIVELMAKDTIKMARLRKYNRKKNGKVLFNNALKPSVSASSFASSVPRIIPIFPIDLNIINNKKRNNKNTVIARTNRIIVPCGMLFRM